MPSEVLFACKGVAMVATAAPAAMMSLSPRPTQQLQHLQKHCHLQQQQQHPSHPQQQQRQQLLVQQERKQQQVAPSSPTSPLRAICGCC
jgi:hypothetical protein